MRLATALACERMHATAIRSDGVRACARGRYDALALLIEHAAKAEAGSEREVLIALLTDGRENASRQRTREQVAKLIEARREAGWTFVFLGANQDAFASAS